MLVVFFLVMVTVVMVPRRRVFGSFALESILTTRELFLYAFFT